MLCIGLLEVGEVLTSVLAGDGAVVIEVVGAWVWGKSDE